MGKRMKKVLKVALYVCLSGIGLCVLAAVGFESWMKWEYHLPPEQHARDHFATHRADYVRFAALLRKDPSTRYVGSDGKVDIDGVHGRVNTEYRDLARRLGLKFVIIREDGSMEFAVWGAGGAIMSDSYMGVRYYPKDHRADIRPGWAHTVVSSLDSDKLPQEHASVATGLYVVAVEPEWFIYRFEYQE